jgi:hypothetical protein
MVKVRYAELSRDVGGVTSANPCFDNSEDFFKGHSRIGSSNPEEGRMKT